MAEFILHNKLLYFFIWDKSHFPWLITLESNRTGRCQFFKNLHDLFGKKITFQYSVSELLDLNTTEKTTVYCS